ncbi:MAG: amidohydrolase [Acidobacteriota bacterium]
MRALPLLLAATLLAGRFAPAQNVSMPPAAPPDLILLDGVIYTGAGLAQGKPQTVEAMAIRDGKVMAVGANAEIRRLAGPRTRIRDLRAASAGVTVFPGFDDAHVHLGSAATQLTNLDLAGTGSRRQMMDAVADYARQAPPGHWITGGHWDQTLWPEKKLPTRQELDRAALGHPAFLVRVDGHIALANTAALQAAGVTAQTQPPQGGAIDHDRHGRLTGILRESAQELVEKVIPPPTPQERRRGLELAIADALANGVTSVQDFSDWQDFLVFEQLEKEDKLNLRITEWIPFNEPLAEEIGQRAHHPADDSMLHTGMLKGFLDGSLGSRTAALTLPYADDPRNSGLPQFTQAELNKMAVERAAAGFQLGFHAIGDRAVSMALDALSQPGVPRAARNRIEHAQVVAPSDVPRFRELGVIASMQPSQLLTDMNWAEARLGPKRAASSYPWKAFLDAGVPLAFGTDYPVEPISPYRGLYAAVTRMNEAGTKSYFPSQKIARGQALDAYTQGSAYAEFAETAKGKLLPGYDADFIVVNRDLFTAPAQDLLHAQTLETFVAGRQVYLANVHLMPSSPTGLRGPRDRPAGISGWARTK